MTNIYNLLLIIIQLSIPTALLCAHYMTVSSIFFRKDVRLPIQLQRAMATEAEAAREARAKVKSTY